MSLVCERLFVILVSGAALVSASAVPLPAQDEPALQRFEFKSAHMGTMFGVSLFATSQAVAEAAAEAAFRRIDALENIMSDYQADSELNLLREKAVGVPVPISTDLFEVLQQGQKLSRLSEGAFDVTIGPYVRLWRFARKRSVLPSPAELESAAGAVGWRKLSLDRNHQTVTLSAPRMQLDLGGIAKGFAADQALEVLRAHGINRALVAASGDIVAGDPPPCQCGWRVAISGLNTASSISNSPVLLLHNSAVSTSGDTEQFIVIDGVRYSHILSPKTGLGLTNRIQATVTAPNATMSDPLATTVCILGPQGGLKLVESMKGVAARVVTSQDGKLEVVTSSRFEKMVDKVK